MDIVKNNLIISEEKSIKNTMLYIKNANINAESYEAKILSEENIENIIKYQIVYDGENRVLRYDVSNTIGLDEYLKTNKLKKEDICKIVYSIDDILLSVENYLLSENSVALDLKFVRVIRKTNGGITFKFIAIPNYNSDFSYELSKFLVRILRFIEIEDKGALSLAYGLFVRSSKDNYTINDLMELVDKVCDKSINYDGEYNVEDLIKYDEEMASEISEDVIEENRSEFVNEEIKSYSEINNVITSSDDSGLVIDATTKGIIGENLLDNFDKEDKKIKKNKALKGNISLNFVGFALAPIIIVALPLIYFFVRV